MTATMIEALVKRVPVLAADLTSVSERLDQLLACAVDTWPRWIDQETYVDYVGDILEKSESAAGELASLHDTDLYLAAAVLNGSRPALEMLESRIRRISQKVVRRMRGDEAAGSDIASETVEKLLVGSSRQAPRISHYRGRGSLAGWIRAVVTRGYLDSVRRNKREVLMGDAAVIDAMEREPKETAIAYLKSECRGEFAAAFEAAIDRLNPRQRCVLRYRFVDGVSIEAIAAVYGIHRATCHRWINDARAALADHIEVCLDARLGNEGRVPEMRALVESQLDLSLSRIFATR